MKSIKSVEQIDRLAKNKKCVVIKYGSLHGNEFIRQPAAFVINYQGAYLVSLVLNKRIFEYKKSNH